MNNVERAALAAAKEKLVLEGQLYRVSVVHAKAQVAHALRPDAIVHSAIEHALGAVQHRFAGLFGGGARPGTHAEEGASAGLGGLASLAGIIGLVKGMGLTRALPVAIRVGSFVARRRLVKPALLAGAAALAAGLWLSRRK
ncbi:hypothetical protein ASC94_28515 [Massilia sp. Root418]|uniref:hypothetical protein n=1 Tax=Massilia sp. Root418 TaxID=1736532 RepID=UPI0006FB247A|nr:hypothetical protein [Massilia sp. Root418]KQW87333.1 hypothetical protein ASC94_28515 [Massilia sp. Root418]